MYSEELEMLIDAALADGELTEKEKQILFKKAQTEGIDLDEFEMVLNARLVKMKKSQEAKPEVAPKSNKIGDVKKCPACGAMVPPYHSSCPECGFQFNEVGTSQSVEKFVEKLDAMESNRITRDVPQEETKKGCWYWGAMIVFFMYVIPIKAIKIIWGVVKSNAGGKPKEWDNTDRRKEEFIMNYPIPISFGEMVEFLTLANSKIRQFTIMELFGKTSAYDMEWNKVWIKKIEQIESKAKIAMVHDQAMLTQVTSISTQAKETQAKNEKTSKTVAFAGLGAIVLIIIIFLSII